MAGLEPQMQARTARASRLDRIANSYGRGAMKAAAERDKIIAKIKGGASQRLALE
jgi:ssDNA-binding replication factor A large subunit